MTDIYGLAGSLGKANILRTDGKENEFLNGKGIYVEFEDITKQEIDDLFP